MEAFLGSWQLKDSGDLNAIVTKMGATIPKERLEQMSKSVMAFSSDGNDSYKVSVTTGGHTQDTKFKLGEAFDHDTMDGRHIKTMKAGEVSCVRYYTKV